MSLEIPNSEYAVSAVSAKLKREQVTSLNQTLKTINQINSLTVKLNSFSFLLWPIILNSFRDTRTLCSTYYTRELSHLNLGRGTRARACGCTKVLIRESGKCGVKAGYH